MLTLCHCGSPHLAASARQNLTETAAVITPGVKTNMAPAILKTKILKDSKKGLLELFQPISSDPQGRLQGVARLLAIHMSQGDVLCGYHDHCLVKPTAFSTSSCSDPAAKGTTVPWS